MKRRIRIHLPGIMYAGLLTLVGLAAMNNQNNLLFWVFGVLTSGLVISGLVTNLTMRSLSVRRIDPQHGAVGEPLVVRYAVTNRGRFMSAFNIHIEEKADARLERVLAAGQQASQDRSAAATSTPEAWVMHVGPHETVHGETFLWPTRRGKIAFDQIRIWTSFPIGITRKTRVVSQSQYTLIYPMLYELRPKLLNAITPRGLLGAKIAPHSGAGDDYFGTREYRPGDSMRHIAWKRAARTDQLITIERASPSPARMRIILDLTVPTEKLHAEPGGHEQARDLEERAISLAASLVHAADLDGYEVGLTVMGLDLPPIVVRRNRWHHNKIMAALAGLDLDQPRQPPRSQPLRDAERAAIVVIAPDRVQTILGREDAWYLTARQLESLAVRPIGWDPRRRSEGTERPGSRRLETAA